MALMTVIQLYSFHCEYKCLAFEILSLFRLSLRSWCTKLERLLGTTFSVPPSPLEQLNIISGKTQFILIVFGLWKSQR